MVESSLRIKGLPNPLILESFSAVAACVAADRWIFCVPSLPVCLGRSGFFAVRLIHYSGEPLAKLHDRKLIFLQKSGQG